MYIFIFVVVFFIGLIGGVIVIGGVWILECKFWIDDLVGVIGVYGFVGVSGIIGLVFLVFIDFLLFGSIWV